MPSISTPDFQDAFDPVQGSGYQLSRAYWLGRCSELIYPSTEAEKAADQKARAAKAAEKAISPPWWKRWQRSARTEEFEQARVEALDAVSAVAGTEAARIEAEVKAWGFDRFQFFSGISTQCFVAASNQIILLCFRGTEPNRLMDIYDDLVAIPMRYPEVAGQVHVGFWTALKQVWRDIDAPDLVWPSATGADVDKGITDALREFRDENNPQPVWIAGHSLGGALATVAAARLVGEEVLRAKDIAGVYTFGQPRVGDQDFAEAYPAAERHFRVVHDNDVVTRVPPRSLGPIQAAAGLFFDQASIDDHDDQGMFNLQYRHVGHLGFLSGGAGIKLDISQWELLARRVLARFKALVKKGSFLERVLPGIPDHSILKYNAALTRAVNAAVLDSRPTTVVEAEMGISRDDSSPREEEPGTMDNNKSNLLSVFSGSGVGLLVGMLMGLSVSPTVGLVIGGLASSLALILGLNDRHFSQAKAIRIGTFGFVCLAGALLGTHMRTHQVLAPSMESQFKEYRKLGYEKPEALDLIKLTRFGIANPDWKMVGSGKSSDGDSKSGDGDASMLVQKIGAGVLYGAEIKGSACKLIRDADEENISDQFTILRSVWLRLKNDVVAKLGKENAPRVLLAMGKGICGDKGSKKVKFDNCKTFTGLNTQAGLEQISGVMKAAGKPWERLAEAVNRDVDEQQQGLVLQILISNLCEEKGNG